MKKIKESTGITLIALIITIVVLLILAGVSISIVTGDNGILSQAQNAKISTDLAKNKENRDFSQVDKYIKKITKTEIEKVTDEHPGVLEIDSNSSNTYIINSIEDLVFFAYDVTNGNTYEGKTVNLGLSLDFASEDSYVNANRTDYGAYGYDGELKSILNDTGFIPIGLYTAESWAVLNENAFKGIFDGKYNKIYNVKMVKDEEFEQPFCYGFFTRLAGVVQNLELNNINYDLKIDSLDSFGIGGLLGGTTGTSGNIRNCGVVGKMDVCVKNSRCPNIGSISGSIESNSELSESFSKVNISVDIFSKSHRGDCGMIGINNGVIKNCYSADIIKIYRNDKTGNIAGANWIAGCCGFNQGIVENSYFIGNIYDYEDSISSINLGATVRNYGNGTSNNTFYLDTVNIETNNENAVILNSNSISKTEVELKSDSFIDLLNQNNEGVWHKDEWNINNGFPVLSWQ